MTTPHNESTVVVLLLPDLATAERAADDVRTSVYEGRIDAQDWVIAEHTDGKVRLHHNKERGAARGFGAGAPAPAPAPDRTTACPTAGTPYEAAYGNTKSPDCGHVYEKSSSKQAGGKYTVTATSDWVITWEGAGQTGTIRLNGLTRTVAIAVGEAQVLVQ